MLRKKIAPDSETKICSICNAEIFGAFEHIKTKRRKELYICKKCLPGNMNKN